MKISFLIPAIVLYLYLFRGAFSNNIPVGTVLFTTTDLVRKCWTESDKSLLKARLIMQDVLPDPDYIDFKNPDVVAILLDYFHSCYRIISTNTYGKIQNLMYLALSDALGGYLRGYVLPFTRRAYYAGQVKYLDARKLFKLYEDIKLFLKTNGMGWIEPQKICPSKFYVRPLVITGGSFEACKELYVIEKEGKLHCINPHKYIKDEISEEQLQNNQKESFREDTEKFMDTPKRIPGSNLKDEPENSSKQKSVEKKNCQLSFSNFRNSSTCSQKFFKEFAAMISRNGTREDVGVQENSKFTKRRSRRSGREIRSEERLKRVIVPLPVLDDCESPHSIAVPFTKNPFRNLKSGSSAFVLEYYYLAVMKCFIAKGNTRTDLLNFNEHLRNWLQCQVLPRLNDEQWYPGFGGVLRIMKTIKKFGYEKNFKDPALHDIAFMFGPGSEFEVQEDFGDKGKNKVREVEEFSDAIIPLSYSKRHMITAIIIVSMIWLFIFCAMAFYCQATRGRKLLYEGCPQPAPPPKQHHPCSNKEPLLNFQFLVKFFKRNEEANCKYAEDGWGFNIKPQDRPQTVQYVETDFSKKRTLKDKLQERLGDANYFTPLFPCVMPTRQYLSSYTWLKGQKPKDKGGTKSRNRGGGDQVQMLWKKPSVTAEGRDRKSRKKRYPSTMSGTESDGIFGRTTSNSCSICLEDRSKGYTSDKQTSTCYCSEGCPFVQTTSTSTSTLQMDKLSSATLQFFEEVIGKRKPKPRKPTHDLESETESCTSTTSECSTTTRTIGDNRKFYYKPD